MTLKASNYPTVRPSLDLNFAQTERLDPRITYSRASSGTYFDSTGTLQSAATNEARFDHDPATGESLGLLVEAAGTNNQANSNNFAVWANKVAVTLIPNAGLSPDGTFTSTKIIPTTASSTHYIGRYQLYSGGSYYAHSIFLKAAGYSRVLVTVNTLSFIAVLSGDGSINSDTGLSAGIQRLPNNWFRVTCTWNNAAGGGANMSQPRITIVNDSNSNSFAGDGISGIEVFGYQQENASFPTSYIPTPATFTSRSTTATYYDASGVIQTAGIDVARDDAYFPDENGVMRPAGLLLEAAGTNLATNSGSLSSWSPFGAPIRTYNATTSPDGTTSATRFEKSRISKEVIYTGVGTGVQSRSFFAKAGTSSFVFIEDGIPFIWFDLSNGTVPVDPYGEASIVALPNGWYRCTVTKSWYSNNFALGISDSSGGTDAAIGNYAYFWGAQAEASPYPTSYIPTSGSTVTRAADVSSSSTVTRSADVAQITGSNFSSWYNQSEGTVLAKLQNINQGSANAIWSFDDGTSSQRIMYRVGYGFIITGATDIIDGTSPFTAAHALAFEANSYSASKNGSLYGTGTPPTVVPLVNKLQFGTSPGLNRASGHISRLTYYPVRLPDATLQTLTS